MISSKKKKVHQRVHHYTLSTTFSKSNLSTISHNCCGILLFGGLFDKLSATVLAYISLFPIVNESIFCGIL